MQSLIPIATSKHCSEPIHIHPSLKSCSHVYLRIDSVKPPLQQPYSGPHPVIERYDKTFIISVHGKNQTVSIDRLKPAFFISDKTFVPNTKPSNKTDTLKPTMSHVPKTVTKSGRHVNFPQHLSTTYYI
ncbi:uncharacterized protein LOC118204370 [Stegodyphus dumicola]|uniref:uncharacterized protein LOC118204370 n=1 Tax=Stegodyphus dumicola TaxID=202533 RepID=UPI0015A82D19|nr:uncharacterized protein LOC118204370 [Stegodyphus dumicola]